VTIESFADDAATIRRQAGLCLKRVDLSRRIRLLGVRVGKLVKPGTEGAPAPGYSESITHKTPRDKATDEHTDLLFPELDA
jgi:DNA polymerase-4